MSQNSKFFLLLFFQAAFFLLLTYAEIKAVNWLKALFFLESAKKKKLPKRTAFSGHLNQLIASYLQLF